MKYISLGMLLLFLFHFDSSYIGPVKVSHLWKGTLLLFLIFKFISNRRKIFFIYKPLIFLAFIQFLNIEIINDPFNAVFLFAITLITPLLGLYILTFSYQKLQKSLIFIASFFILAFVPYELGILKSINSGYNLESYGVEISGLIGPFQTVHSASMTLGASFVVIFYFLFDKRYNRNYLLILLVLCFYFLFGTYVRTGMAMAAIGIIPIIIYFGKKENRARIRLIFMGILFTLMFSAWVFSNEVLVNRIMGNTERVSENESIDTMGSGRGGIWKYSMDIYLEANYFEKLFGIGQGESLNRMENKTNSRIFPHNGFLQTLLINGLFGFIAFLLYLRNIYRLRKRLYKEHFILIKSLIYAFIVMGLFQSIDLLYVQIILMLAVTIFNEKNHLIKIRNSRPFIKQSID